jgi:hypothetical protein
LAGFIPQTLCEDNDPLDVLVVMQSQVCVRCMRVLQRNVAVDAGAPATHMRRAPDAGAGCPALCVAVGVVAAC